MGQTMRRLICTAWVFLWRTRVKEYAVTMGGVEIFLTMAHFLPANTGLWIGRRGTGFRKRNAKLLIQPGEQLVSAHLVDRIGLRCGEMIGESTMKPG